MPSDEHDRAVDLAVRALARRDHSAASLETKLERSGVPEAERSEAVRTLVRLGYLDDERFARDRAAALAERGYGDEWIRADLDAQGVAAELRETAVAALGPEPQRARREAQRLGGGVRAARTLARKGFSEESLEGVVAGAVADDAPEGVG